jgi:membrane-bound lytic murein transglycosylase F
VQNEMKRAALVSAVIIAAVSSCSRTSTEEAGIRAGLEVGRGDLDAVRERGGLRILVPTLSEDHLPRDSAPDAEDREMASAFAARLGLDAEFIVVASRSELLDLLEEGYGDVALAQLTATPARAERFLFSQPTETVSEWLVGRRGEPNLPRRQKALDGREVHVRASSAFEETLLRVEREEGIDLRIVHVEESLDTETIAYEVSRGQRPLTVVDSNLLRSIETYNDDLEPLFAVAEGREIAWAIRKDAKDLAAAADTFINEHHLTDHRTDDRTTLGLAAIKRRGSLRVLTLNNPVNYFLYRGQPMGLDYELTKLAARQLGVRLEMVVPPRRDWIFPWLLEGRADVIGSTLTVTAERQDFLAFTAPYLFIEELVVEAANTPNPVTRIEDLRGHRVYAWQSSSHYRTLMKLQGVVGPFEIGAIPEDMEFEEILDHVANGEYPLAVLDSHILQAELPFRNDVVIAFPLSDPRDEVPSERATVAARDKAVAFAVRKENPGLKAFLDEFIRRERRTLEFNVILNRYIQNNRRLPRVKVRRAAVSGRISPYDELFKKYGSRYGLDWRLLVAQAYQESRFNPKAESWAGARGLFQLLPSTGLELGFEDLDDPETGIHAGARHMHLLLERLGPSIPYKHRLRFALAAYNAGWGHLEDARRLAEEMGWDENKWFGHTEKAMLLLNQPEYYRRARHGYVRGREPVAYVSAIQNLYDHYVRLVPP